MQTRNLTLIISVLLRTIHLNTIVSTRIFLPQPHTRLTVSV
ncbi:BgtTE-56116 [Blumeria graminis f. sp. tritici]|uniref:BgtTE-56116 n=1 Tax=Blumeria graminis f. sp. tritici TaxID=62690 RepID=A0A9X9QG77_BLUGR|nr:BgtTE-56116 [Blumeria graminis f. sp. tritici]